MSIRWIRNVIIDGEKSTIEIQLGDRRIGDKCYTRIGTATEKYFDNMMDTRDDIVAQGVDILKKTLEGKALTYPDGRDYDWQ
ncbi:MAG: hypothetical protein GF418_06025 [Chitinivibrionales bacterium]|nr:hypothetical protein [Chitinivibrionales bacterium]MBD3395169.1 hypothetical protein [Chitinivibrionales bacterium]